MHGAVLLDAAGEVLRPAILWNDQRTAAECDEIREAVGPERLIEITGNDALTGFTAPKLVWVRDHEPEVWARSPTCCCRRTTSGCASPASTPSTRPTAPGTILFDLAARDWSAEVLAALRIDRALDAADIRGPDVTGTVTAAAAARNRAACRHPGRGRRRRPVGQRGRRGRRRAGTVALSLGTSGVVFAATDRPIA